MIEIRKYVSDLLFSNMYLVVEQGHAIVIDPFEEVSPADGLEIDRIILTHEHYDHISGVNMWKKARDVPVLCSRACAENIQNPRKNLAHYFREFCELQTWISLDEIPPYDADYSCKADESFEDELRFSWMGHHWHLFGLPGQSLGSIGIVLDDQYFFSGDSLLENCETSLRIPGGSQKKWQETGLPRLRAIPDGIRVYPGHFENFKYVKSISSIQ